MAHNLTVEWSLAREKYQRDYCVSVGNGLLHIAKRKSGKKSGERLNEKKWSI